MSSRPIPVSARRVARNRAIQAAGFAPLLLIPLLAIAAISTGNPMPMLGSLHAIIGTAVLSTWLRRRNFKPRLEDVALSLDDDALHVGDHRIPRASLLDGYLAPGGTHTRVRLIVDSHRKAPLELAVANWDSGNAVLDALGLGVGQSASQFSVASRVHAHPVLFGLAMVGTFFAGGMAGFLLTQLAGPAAAALPVIALTFMFVLMFLPTKLTVGADGVAARWMGRDNFLSYDDIEAVQRSIVAAGKSRYDTVEIQMRSGKKHRWAIEQARWSSGVADAIHARIHAALNQHRRQDVVQPQALARREDRTHLDWVRVLESSLQTGAHRSAALTEDALWRTITDHGTAALERAAAAVALGRQLREPQREKLRRIAGSVASPKLRIAIESVAEEQEAQAVAEALAELEREANA